LPSNDRTSSAAGTVRLTTGSSVWAVCILLTKERKADEPRCQIARLLEPG
jgi:hypothetical protein